MRINNKQSLYESFVNNLNSCDNVEKQIDKVDKVKAEPKKVDLREVFKISRHKRINESVQGLANVIWGSDVIADEEHMGEDYELFSIICSNIEEAEDDYNDGKISKSEFIDKIKIQCHEGQLNDEETKAVIDFYEKSYSDSPEDMGDEDSFTMYNSDYDKEVNVWKRDGKWYDDEGNRYMGYLSKQDVKNYFKGNWRELKEAVEQKYNKSNQDYNRFLNDVKKYTGSYDYLFGGKVDTECYGYPITVKYFYYNRPYVGGGYNIVVNVLTPMDSLAGDGIQEAIENAFERNSKTKLSQKEIKDKIVQVVSSLK